ncbi:helix-turn-helix domain-containing protein [Streptococcus halichoeri]|uniref:helix-turn-helix domain-containing protein n=1 Tax=Streptococcus halichoeri TaxID=254785 RepID=UPI0013570A25|nr:helix-turn-helix domain-containing protein [Streptococcus halichoeri]
MLDNYLETSINHQIVLMTLLLDEQDLTLQTIREKTGLSLVKIKVYIRRLSELFDGVIAFEYEHNLVHCRIISESHQDYLHMIYNQSLRLQALKFLLQPIPSHQVKSVAHFAKDFFVSIPSAYRIINSIIPFIGECGLKVVDNNIVGEEWRLRYLIALVHAKYGLVIYEISDVDLQIIHDFIFSMKKEKALQPFLDKKFLFFDLLVTLSWKRREFDIRVPPQAIFSDLKHLSLYDYLTAFFNRKGKLLLGMPFPSQEIDYLFLVYLTVSNSFLITQWSKEDVQKLFAIIHQDMRYQDLLERLTLLFGPYITFDNTTICALLPYFRKTLFDLQVFIPPKYYYSTEYHGNQALLERLGLLMNDWVKNNSGVGNLTSSNLHLLCLRFEQLIKENLSPLKIVVTEVNKKKLDILGSLVAQQVYLNQATVDSVNIIFGLTLLKMPEVDLIITTSELASFIKEELELPATTKIISLNFDFIDYQSDYLSQVIKGLREKQYQEVLKTILGNGQPV